MANNQDNESSDGEQQFLCEKCGQDYKHSSSLSRHKKTCGVEANTELPCSKCQKVFNRKDNLDRHIANCKGVIEWKCEHCNKTFEFASYLKRHTCQFKCNDCGKRLKTVDQPHQCKVVNRPNVPSDESPEPEAPQKKSPEPEAPQKKSRERESPQLYGKYTYRVPSVFWEEVNIALLLGLDEKVKVGHL